MGLYWGALEMGGAKSRTIILQKLEYYSSELGE